MTMPSRLQPRLGVVDDWVKLTQAGRAQKLAAVRRSNHHRDRRKRKKEKTETWRDSIIR